MITVQPHHPPLPPQGIVLVHNIMTPYRLGLFNTIHNYMGNHFRLVLGRWNHPKRRAWTVNPDDVDVPFHMLRTISHDNFRGAVDVSYGLGGLLDELQPACVVVGGWDLPANWAALRWCRRRRVPAIGWIESWEGSLTRRRAWVDRIRHAYLRRCAAVIVPGVAAESLVQRLHPGLPCTHMPNSVDVPALRDLPAADPGGDAYFVGELTSRKGVDILLEAAPELAARFPRIHLIGSGPLSEACQRARPHGFVTHGHLSSREIAEVAATCSTFILPSRSDPWPLAAVEALVARRRAALGPGVGSGADLVASAGPAVAMMATDNPDALLAAVDSVAEHMVPERLATSYTHDESAQRFVDTCRAAIAGST